MDGEITGDELDSRYGTWDHQSPRGTEVWAYDLLKGEYFLRFYTGYNFSLTLTPEYADSTYEESVYEENYNENTAKKIECNKTIKGALSMNEIDGDFYKLNVGSKGTLKVTVNTKVNDVQMAIYKAGKTPQTIQLVSGKSVNTLKLDSKGTYYVVVRKDGGTGNYNFKMKFKKK